MRAKTRNSLIVIGIWPLVTVGGLLYGRLWQQQELEGLENTSAQLAQLPDITNEVDSLAVRYEELKKEYNSRKKEIPKPGEAEQRYTAIIDGLDQAGQMKLDIEVGGVEDLGDWGYSRYSLKNGEGQFNNIYKFIYYLENLKTLQKIYGLQLIQEEKTGEEGTRKSIKFQMELHSYFSKMAEVQSSPSAKSAQVSRLPLNPFSPQSARVVVREIQPSEVVVDAVEVKATISGKALVQFMNALIVLRVGDRIRGGYVSDIDPTESKVEFTMEEGGVTRKVEKRIEFTKK